MKKVLAIIVAVVCIGLYANAQNASGSCKLPGTYDYINVDYYESDGHIVVSNQSEMKITQLHVTITCTITREWEEGPYYQSTTKKDTKTVTICNKNFYDIPANQSTTLSDGIKSRNDIQMPYGIKYEYTVKVGNPICQ